MKSAIFSKMMRSSQRLPIVIYGVAIIFFMSFSATDLHGQFKKPKYLKPTITLAYEKIPEKSFHDTAGHFGFDKALLSLRIPLYTQFLKGKKAGSFGFWGIMLNIDGACTWHRFSWLPSRQIFIEGTGGLSAWYYGGRRSVYLISINSRMAEDIYSVNNPGLFYSGFILRNHNISRILSYTLGISYSHVYGRGLPLPVIGATFIIGKRNRIHFMLPFRADYNLRFSERSRLVLFLRPNGGLINVSNRNRYPDYPSIFSFRQRVFRAGVLVELGIGSAWSIIPEAGVDGKRKISFSQRGESSGKEYFKASTNTGWYARVALRYRFGAKPYHGESDPVNYLIENGMDVLQTDLEEN